LVVAGYLGSLGHIMSPCHYSRFLFTVVASPCLAGCFGIPISEVSPAGERSAEIFVVREKFFSGSLVSQYLSIDGVTIARLDSGEYTKFSVSEGAHSLQIRWKVWLHGPYVKTAQFEAKNGASYLFVTWGQVVKTKAESDYADGMGIVQQDWTVFDRKIEGKSFVAPGH
jgi:hypothetical protein